LTIPIPLCSYTNHTVAVIRGYCAEAVARNSSRLALSVLRRGARLKKHGHDDDDRDDDDEEGDLDDIWDPEDDDIWDDCCGWADIFGDDDDGDDDEASGGGDQTPEPPTPPKEEDDDAKAFRRERPGTALGCIKSSRGDRDFCSTKRGCRWVGLDVQGRESGCILWLRRMHRGRELPRLAFGVMTNDGQLQMVLSGLTSSPPFAASGCPAAQRLGRGWRAQAATS
jgi:hypothetical protein